MATGRRTKGCGHALADREAAARITCPICLSHAVEELRKFSDFLDKRLEACQEEIRRLRGSRAQGG